MKGQKRTFSVFALIVPKHVSLEIQENLTFNEMVSTTTKNEVKTCHTETQYTSSRPTVVVNLKFPNNAAIYLDLVLHFAQTRTGSLPDCALSTSYLSQLAEIKASVNAD